MSELEFTKVTDEVHEIELDSEMVFAKWKNDSAFAGQATKFRIKTFNVGDGAEIEITGKSTKGKSFGKTKDTIFRNYYEGSFNLPEDMELGDEIYFEVKLPKNDLSYESASIPVKPMIGVFNLQWSEDEALDGDELTLSADVSQVEEETEATVTVYEYDKYGAHEVVVEIQTEVKNQKIEFLWTVKYKEDLNEHPSPDELEEYGEEYERPKYFFTVKIEGAEYGKIDQSSGFLIRPIHSATILAFEDVLFRHESAVLLPDRDYVQDTGQSNQEAITGLSVIKTAILYAFQNKSKKLVIAGHTDSTGGDVFNFKISKERALNILAVIENERDDWVKISSGRYVNKDIQHILAWLGFSPGPIDGIIGEKTKDATKNFQHAVGLVDDGIFGKKTWGAVFDRYQSKLEQAMEDEQNGVEALNNRGTIEWLYQDKKAVGCGELFPIEYVGVDNQLSQTNRRIEALFFSPKAIPENVCKDGICQKDQCLIYRKELFQREYIKPDSLVQTHVNWLSEIPLDFFDTVQLVIHNDDGDELDRLDCQPICTPDGCYLFGLERYEEKFIHSIELHSGNVPLAPPMRMDVGALRTALKEENLSAVEESFGIVLEEGESSQVFDGELEDDPGGDDEIDDDVHNGMVNR